MISFCQFGAGRIGQVHAGNIARHPKARLKTVVDVSPQAAKALAERHGATVGDVATALADPGIDAVLIASSTDTHATLVEAAARARKPVLCEKPLDLDCKRAQACLDVATKAGIPLMLGFNRRFDLNFSKLQEQLREGRIGRLEMLTITSRDPGPPPLDYVKVSGGLFRDMTIHDFDMARWLLGEEPVQVTAAASALVDSAIGGAGDVDTAVVTLKTAAGTLCQITNSRRATYGYDQRIEALGSKGMLRANNVVESTLEFASEAGVITEKPLQFFLERYAAAYRHELDHFIESIEQRKPPMVGGADGVRALALAEAALESSKTGRTVDL